jgi:hypothetical protein
MALLAQTVRTCAEQTLCFAQSMFLQTSQQQQQQQQQQR